MNNDFRAWLAGQSLKPSSQTTYLSDLRRVEKRFGEIDPSCKSGEVDKIIDAIKASGEAGRNKSANQEIQAIRTYLRFLDDHLLEEIPAVSSSQDVSEAQRTSLMPVGFIPVPKSGKGLVYANGYWHPPEFPREAFVQKSVERHFLALGSKRENGGHADWVCKHPETGDRWHVECKGLTTAVGLDFRTGMGQLVQAMKLDKTNYAVAVPRIDAFLRQIERIDPDFVALIGIKFLLVKSDGDLSVYGENLE